MVIAIGAMVAVYFAVRVIYSFSQKNSILGICKDYLQVEFHECLLPEEYRSDPSKTPQNVIEELKTNVAKDLEKIISCEFLQSEIENYNTLIDAQVRGDWRILKMDYKIDSISQYKCSWDEAQITIKYKWSQTYNLNSNDNNNDEVFTEEILSGSKFYLIKVDGKWKINGYRYAEPNVEGD